MKQAPVAEYQVHGYYGGPCGWEEVMCDATLSDARVNLQAYRENEPGTLFKLVTKRVKA